MSEIMRFETLVEPHRLTCEEVSRNIGEAHMLPDIIEPKLEHHEGLNYVPHSGSTDSSRMPFLAPAGTPESAHTSKAPRGRSLGENSSQPIKKLRVRAEKGDMEAALKLGWSVERLTAIFNQRKAAKGEHTFPGQPIDDPMLLARIQDRHRAQSEAAKKRATRLKAQALAGDITAAKKLKYGSKRMAELFPGQDHDASPSPLQEQNPYDIDKDHISRTQEPTDQAISSNFGMPSQDENPTRSRSHWNVPTSQDSALGFPQPYPMPPAGYDLELQLRKEYEHAREEAIIIGNHLTQATHANTAAQARLQEVQRRYEVIQRANKVKTKGKAKTSFVRPRLKKTSWEMRRSNFEDEELG